MNLPTEWQAIIEAFKDTGNYSAEQSVRAAVERCYALHSKPPKELTDAELCMHRDEMWPDHHFSFAREAVAFARAIEAAVWAKQREPEKVKFRAARRKGANYPEMLVATDALNPNWEWLEPEQSFEVVLP